MPGQVQELVLGVRFGAHGQHRPLRLHIQHRTVVVALGDMVEEPLQSYVLAGAGVDTGRA
jgi:hypothetical protein